MAFDNLLMFFTNTTVTVNVSSGAKQINGTPSEGLGVRISVPTATHANDTLQGRVWVSADNVTYRVASTSVAKAALTSGGDIIFSFQAPKSEAKWAKLELILAGTTKAFGQVKAGIVPEHRGIDRTTNFE